MVFSNSDWRATIFGSCPGQLKALGICHLAQGLKYGVQWRYVIQLITGTTLCEGHAKFEHIYGMNKNIVWSKKMGRSFLWYTVQDQAAQNAWAVKLAYDVTTIKGS